MVELEGRMSYERHVYLCPGLCWWSLRSTSVRQAACLLLASCSTLGGAVAQHDRYH